MGGISAGVDVTARAAAAVADAKAMTADGKAVAAVATAANDATAKANAAQAAAIAAGFGVGQHQTNVTATRALGVTYTNTGARTRRVSVFLSGTLSYPNFTIYVNGQYYYYNQSGVQGAQYMGASADVAPGETYSVTSNLNISTWLEDNV